MQRNTEEFMSEKYKAIIKSMEDLEVDVIKSIKVTKHLKKLAFICAITQIIAMCSMAYKDRLEIWYLAFCCVFLFSMGNQVNQLKHDIKNDTKMLEEHNIILKKLKDEYEKSNTGV